MLNHLLECGFACASLKPIPMSPSPHPVQTGVVQHSFHIAQICEVGTDITGFQRDTVDAEPVRPSQEILLSHSRGRYTLLRIHFAKEPVITITIDTNLHGVVRCADLSGKP